MNDTVMLNGVIKALKALNAGPVYDSELKQGFVKPSFFANRINTAQKLLGSGFKQAYYYFDVIYYVDNKPAAYEMGETLAQALFEVDTEDGTVRGIDMSYQYVEDSLHFYVTYPVRMRTTAPEELMETLKVEGSVKDG